MTRAWQHAALGSLLEMQRKAMCICRPVLPPRVPDRHSMSWVPVMKPLLHGFCLTLLGGKAERSIGMGLQSTV